jgi:hypothetical protein
VRVARFAAVGVLAVAASGCRTYFSAYYLGSADYELASRDGANGRKEIYRLEVRGEASLQIITEYQRVRPFLGFQVVELGSADATRRGMQPFTGVLIRGVYPRSSAEEGGVKAGDVLVQLGKTATTDPVHVPAVERRLQLDETVVATVLRDGDRLDLPLVCKQVSERVTDQEAVPLVAPPVWHRPYAGLTLRGIPEVWCERIWGVKRQAVVVAGIELGSPAWLAGLRGGDVIDTVDGAPVPDIGELSARIAERGAAEQPMHFGVRRGNDPPHSAEVRLGDYSGERTVWIPLVFRVEDGTYEDAWSHGPFGLLVSNRNHWLADNRTRVGQTKNVFETLFGLVQVTATPEESTLRLFWFLTL